MKTQLVQFLPSDIVNNIDAIKQSYSENGVIYLRNFVNEQVHGSLSSNISDMHHRAELDLKQNWDNKKICFYSRNAKAVSIKDDFAAEPYFLSSKDKTHVFYEAIEGDYIVNRIGHGMHLSEHYQALQSHIYQNELFQSVLKATGFIRPICHLSVYIPKNPHGAGSLVRPHQESTFAYTEPQTAAVLWIALENALIENACMWGIPGSNKWPLKYISRMDHEHSQREFLQINEVDIPDFELQKSCYTPLEVSAGDALFFHGNFIHCSPANQSTKSRKAISMQFIDTVNVSYPSWNWINPTNNKYLYTS